MMSHWCCAYGRRCAHSTPRHLLALLHKRVWVSKQIRSRMYPGTSHFLSGLAQKSPDVLFAKVIFPESFKRRNSGETCYVGVDTDITLDFLQFEPLRTRTGQGCSKELAQKPRETAPTFLASAFNGSELNKPGRQSLPLLIHLGTALLLVQAEGLRINGHVPRRWTVQLFPAKELRDALQQNSRIAKNETHHPNKHLGKLIYVPKHLNGCCRGLKTKFCHDHLSGSCACV